MRRAIFIVMLLSISLLSCYEYSMLNLLAPTGLRQGEAELMIRHRFYGDVSDDPLANFFGMDAGANVNLNGRYQFYDKAELTFSYSRRKSEKTIGASYLLEIEDVPVFGQLYLQYFSYQEEILKDENRQNLFYALAIQYEQIFERITPTLNTAYDGYNERVILGAGLLVEVMDDVSFIGEYYPVLDRDSASGNLEKYIGEEDAFAIGIKLDTYGHQFLFMLSNSDDIGLRRVSLGVPQDPYLRFGFNIQRRLQW